MVAKTYKGIFNPENLKHPEKYVGDINKIRYLSSWERSAFRWCDLNDNVESWASESLPLFYHNPITNKKQKYFPDLFIQFRNGKSYIVEIKPKHQTSAPQLSPSGRKTKRYIQEMATWLVNESKWKAASMLCKKNNMEFHIWCEDELKSLGIFSLKTDGKTLLNERKQMKRRATKRPKRKS